MNPTTAAMGMQAQRSRPPTLPEVARVYASHLQPRDGIWVPDADAALLVETVKSYKGTKYAKRLVRLGLRMAWGQR